MIGSLFVSVHGALDSMEMFETGTGVIASMLVAELRTKTAAVTPELIPWADRPGHTTPVQVPPVVQQILGTKSGLLLDAKGVQ